jgi:threonine dehydrogenase-like Zn-dependent dehydrogenase
MKAAVLVARQKIQIKDVPEPKAGRGEVLVAPKYAGICGTDVHIFGGEFEARVKYPTILGHEFAGIVAEVGEGVTSVAAGDKVTADPIIPCMRCVACREGNTSGCRSLKLLGVDADGGFAQYVVAAEERVFRLPERVTVRDAAMVEIFSIGVHATRRGEVDPDDFVVVLGAGRLGLSIISVLKQSSAGTIVATDVRDSRLEIARKVGADYCINSAKKDAVKEVMALTDGVGADRVFEAVGHAARAASGLQPVGEAAEMVRNAGRVIVLGQGPEPEPVFWRPFVWKEATMTTSRVTRGEFPRAISMLAKGALNPAPLITHEVPLDYAADAFRLIVEGKEEAVKVLLKIE